MRPGQGPPISADRAAELTWAAGSLSGRITSGKQVADTDSNLPQASWSGSLAGHAVRSTLLPLPALSEGTWGRLRAL